MTRRVFAVGGASAGLGLAQAAHADGGLAGPVRIFSKGRETAAYRACPPGGPRDAPVLVFAPAAAGRCAPMHRAFVRRLAREGFYVVMPELSEEGRRLDLAAAYGFAAREGASARRIGLLGYDGGTRTVREALAADGRILAGAAYTGPLLANPISRPEDMGPKSGEARMLVLAGPPGFIADPAPTWDAGLGWLRARGLG